MLATTAIDTATTHLQAAIGVWAAAIDELELQGTRPGSIVTSTNGNGYAQHHWVHDSKRTYVSKQKVSEYQAEIERGRVVTDLQQKIATAQTLMEIES